MHSQYYLTKLLGSGTFGAVYAATTSDNTTELVAVKRSQKNSRKPSREIEILMQLQHPFCVKMLDFFYTIECGHTPAPVFTSWLDIDVSSESSGEQEAQDSGHCSDDFVAAAHRSIIWQHIVMPFFPMSLESLLKQSTQPLPFDTVIEIFSNVCTASMELCH
jgi:serine/threonine protein kinase